MESPSFWVADSQVSFLLQSTVFLQESKSRQEAAMWSGGQERLWDKTEHAEIKKAGDICWEAKV